MRCRNCRENIGFNFHRTASCFFPKKLIEMERSFNLASWATEFSSPCHWRLLRMKEKPFVSRRSILNCFRNRDHSLVSNFDIQRLRVFQSLMLQESFIGEKHLEEEKALGFESVRTLLIDNYDSYTYNIYQELAVINGVPPCVVHNDEWTWDYICNCLYKEKAFDNIVISPGPGSPTCPADIGICLQILHECKDIPILGVCLGHQALGYVHGARIVHAPEAVHGRLSEIEHIGCNLFHNIPSGKSSGFKVVRYHSLVLDTDSLPKELIPIAWTSSARTHSFLESRESQTTQGGNLTSGSIKEASPQSLGNSEDWESTEVLMGVMHSSRPHYGVQFHPESIATCHGRQIFKNFRNMTVDYWLSSSLVQERKVHRSVSLVRRLRKNPPRNKTLVANGTAGDCLEMCKKVVNAYKSADVRYLKLQWRKFDSLANQVGGSRNIFCELFGNQKAEDTFWLDSSSVDQRRARFSFMGSRGGSMWKQITYWLSDQSNMADQGGGYLSIEDVRGSVRNTFLKDGILDFLNKELQSFHYDKEEYEGLPFDFCGGYIGFIGRMEISVKMIFSGVFLSASIFWRQERQFAGKLVPLESLTETQRYHLRLKKLKAGVGLRTVGDLCISLLHIFDIVELFICSSDSYGVNVECGIASSRHKSKTPDACFFFADHLLVIDHSNGDVYILSVHNTHHLETTEVGLNGKLDDWLDKTEQRLLGLKSSVGKNFEKWERSPGTWSPGTSTLCKEGFVIDKSRDQYIKDVNRCLNFIRDGESYELCLTTQMRKSVKDIDALGLYLNLREKNPAPYAAWLHFARDDLRICSSSPERFLRLDRNGILEAKPIKGTVARGTTPEEDERLKLQLQHSEKDQAENLMIVDLLRNDLGRVCEPGTVHVPRLMEVESYATVHTLVSTIRGKKRSNLSPIECVRAAFPGGSMTGAPKLRSMELLDSLEGCSRGVYSGSIGFFSYNQTFDLNIVIRTVVIHGCEASIGAGGAIVAFSKPEDEYEEMLLKARAPAGVVTEYHNQSD